MKAGLRTRGAVLMFTGNVLTVQSVTPGGAVDAAGLEPGDQIVRVFGSPLAGALREGLAEALAGSCLVHVLDARTNRVTSRWVEFGQETESARLEESITRQPLPQTIASGSPSYPLFSRVNA